MRGRIIGNILACGSGDGPAARRPRGRGAAAEVRAAERRLAFLAEASAVLAGSLDYEVTLQSVARQAVPTLADICMVDIAAE